MDRIGPDLTSHARRFSADPLAFLKQRQLFGELCEDQRFRRLYREILTSLHQDGTRSTLERLNASQFDVDR